MKVNLHVGAHKTATTFVQSLLAENLSSLNRAGVGYLPLAEMRGGVTHDLMAPRKEGGVRLRSILPRFFAGGESAELRGVVISEENLVGTCEQFVHTGMLYADAPNRLRRVRKNLANHDLRLFFSVRSYETFIASAYCEALRSAPEFIPFDQVRNRLKPAQARWHLVLSQILEVLRPTETFVWRYEEFRANAPAIIRKLAFDTDLPAESQSSKLTERQSFSQPAVEILRAIAASHGRGIAGRLVNPIGDSLPKSEGLPAFDPWSDAERAELQRRYEEDCAQLPVPVTIFPAAAEPDPPPDAAPIPAGSATE